MALNCFAVIVCTIILGSFRASLACMLWNVVIGFFWRAKPNVIFIYASLQLFIPNFIYLAMDASVQIFVVMGPLSRTYFWVDFTGDSRFIVVCSWGARHAICRSFIKELFFWAMMASARFLIQLLFLWASCAFTSFPVKIGIQHTVLTFCRSLIIERAWWTKFTFQSLFI